MAEAAKSNPRSSRGAPTRPVPLTRLLRFHGTSPRDPAIDPWLAARPAALSAIASAWFAVMRGCGRDVREVMHDGCPTACVDDAGFAYVNTFTHHVNVGFFRGADLPDPAGLLQGTGKSMRHVKIRPGVAVDAKALKALIVAAHRDMQARVAAESREATQLKA